MHKLKDYLKQYPAVPVTVSCFQADFDSLTVFKNLNHGQKQEFFLTGQAKSHHSRYSFICLDLQETIRLTAGHLTVENAAREKHSVPGLTLSQLVNQRLAEYQTPRIQGLPPLTGGLVGYFAYDYAYQQLVPDASQLANPLGLADAELMRFKTIVAYNHLNGQVTASQVLTRAEFPDQYEMTRRKLEQLLQQLCRLSHVGISAPAFRLTSPFETRFSLAEFIAKVHQAKHHIVDGDIFQLILSNPQQATMQGSLLGAANTLYQNCPSPYQFYFRDHDFEILGASPETLIRKRGDQLFTYPLAGTRRRGRTAEEDQRFAHELQTSLKETSEHNMLIDLGRNDLGRVSRFGTVRVTKTRALLKFANVMHLGSTVESAVAPHLSGMDIIKSLLPAGTLSGAPKVSAMRLISQLEGQQRGIYGGCLGYFDFDGDLDFCIGIRLAYRQRSAVVVHSGAGIVADSIAKEEYQEFQNKARGVINALRSASEEGSDAVPS